VQSAKFNYDKKKISRVDLEFFNDGWKSKISNGGFMSNLFSQELVQEINKISSKSKSKASSTIYTISFTYDKNNIKERIIAYSEPDYSFKITYQFEKYDTKLNPFYHFYTKLGMADFVGSKNNPLEIIATYTEIEEDDVYSNRSTITYDYTYNGKFPTEAFATERNTWRNTTYYEYQ